VFLHVAKQKEVTRVRTTPSSICQIYHQVTFNMKER